MTDSSGRSELETRMLQIGRDARSSVRALARSKSDQRNKALLGAASAIRGAVATIKSANDDDMAAGVERGLRPAMLDRLALDDARIEGIAHGIEQIAALDDPLGTVIADWKRPNGLRIQRVRVPLGVIGIIYESRPNVTADAAALCIKSGNAAVLRGGSESFASNRAIHACSAKPWRRRRCRPTSVQWYRPATGRRWASCSAASAALDVVVPRGGRTLFKRVQDDARVPVIGHLEGICHVYVHGSADPAMATAIVVQRENAAYRHLRRRRNAVDRSQHAPSCCRTSSAT